MNCVVRASRPQYSSTCRRSVSGVGRKLIVPRPTSTAALMRPPAMATNTSPAGRRNSKSSARTTRSCARNARVGSSSRWNRPSTMPDVVAFVRRHVPSGAGAISSVQVARRPSGAGLDERLGHQAHATAVERQAIAFAHCRPRRPGHEPAIEKRADVGVVRIERGERQEIRCGARADSRLDLQQQQRHAVGEHGVGLPLWRRKRGLAPRRCTGGPLPRPRGGGEGRSESASASRAATTVHPTRDRLWLHHARWLLVPGGVMAERRSGFTPVLGATGRGGGRPGR